MLKQWRFKIVKKFVIDGGEILGGSAIAKFAHKRPRPNRVFLYNPSKRRYDYVDYTGKCGGQECLIDEKTCFLEALGYIKFVESVKNATNK